MELKDYNKLYILNDLPFPTAIHKISVDLFNATDRSSHLVHLGNSSVEWNGILDGSLLRGVQLFPTSLNRTINFVFPKIAYSQLEPLLSGRTSEDFFIQYTNQSIHPLRKNENDIIYINDNPNSVINTDLYSLDRLRRKLTARNYNRYRKFSHVMANSNYVRKSIIDYGFDGEISVINPLGNPRMRILDQKKELRAKWKLPQDKKLILSVTNGVHRKNLSFVKEVVESLGDEYQLVRIGIQVGDSITYNNVTDEEVNELFNACDVLFFPSLEEGFGIPVIEAFAAGLPTVVSDLEIMHEVAGNAAVFIEPTDHSSGVLGIREALNGSIEFIAKSRERSRLYTLERFNKEVSSFYSKILK